MRELHEGLIKSQPWAHEAAERMFRIIEDH